MTESVRLPEHGSCFICGSQNPKGMGLVWYARPDEAHELVVFTDFSFGLSEQGPPGHTHGGASAAVIDEVMGAVVWRSGLKVVLANLNLRPTRCWCYVLNHPPDGLPEIFCGNYLDYISGSGLHRDFLDTV